MVWMQVTWNRGLNLESKWKLVPNLNKYAQGVPIAGCIKTLYGKQWRNSSWIVSANSPEKEWVVPALLDSLSSFIVCGMILCYLDSNLSTITGRCEELRWWALTMYPVYSKAVNRLEAQLLYTITNNLLSYFHGQISGCQKEKQIIDSLLTPGITFTVSYVLFNVLQILRSWTVS